MKKIVGQNKSITFGLPACWIFFQFLICALLNGKEAGAQDITQNNLGWPCTKLVDVAGGSLGNGQTIVNVFKKEKIEWREANGKLIYRFDILETKGTWPDVSKPGEITYRVSMEKKKGMVSIKRTEGIVRINVLLVDKEGQSIYELRSLDTKLIE